jgi:hypothetical protein
VEDKSKERMEFLAHDRRRDLVPGVGRKNNRCTFLNFRTYLFVMFNFRRLIFLGSGCQGFFLYAAKCLAYKKSLISCGNH